MLSFPSLGSPRTGGAHASHYRTAGIDSRDRRRDGCVAACGARTTARADAAYRRAHEPHRGRSGIIEPHRSICAGTALVPFNFQNYFFGATDIGIVPYTISTL